MYYPNRRPQRFPHYVLPSGQLVRLIRWTYNSNKEFIARVTSNGRNRIEFLDSWFEQNAVSVGSMERQF
jgi:hypothetical protein